jgi:hypothetical protein
MLENVMERALLKSSGEDHTEHSSNILHNQDLSIDTFTVYRVKERKKGRKKERKKNTFFIV